MGVEMKGFFYSISVFLLFSVLIGLIALNLENTSWERATYSLEALKVNTAFDAREKILREAFNYNLGTSTNNKYSYLTVEYPFQTGFLTDLNLTNVDCRINGSKLTVDSNNFSFNGGDEWNVSILLGGTLPDLDWDYLDDGTGGKKFSILVSNGSHEISDSRFIIGASRLTVNRSNTLVELGLWPGLQANFSTDCTANFEFKSNDSAIYCNYVNISRGDTEKNAMAKIA